MTIEGQRQIVEPFLMARYPITIVQFRAFVEDCFRDGKWRLPPGFEEAIETEKRKYGEKKLARIPPPSYDPSVGNHAADNVNWYHALAFCHWLGTRLTWKIRLPTEAEWQLAATAGDPELVYPWGHDWDPYREPWRANTEESGLGRTLPAGFYPLGAAATGVLDMAGNLWEWCQNEYVSQILPIARVVRGGSWKDGGARLVSRFRNIPYYSYSSVGFRLVCSFA